jgi:GGDEF domain-containing protein
MNLRQMTAWGQTHPPGENPAALANPERVLTLVVDGAALGVPEIDSNLYQEFRARLGKLTLQLPDHLPEEEKLAQIRCVLNEFQNYRKNGEEELRNRTSAWRSLTAFFFTDLLKSLGIDPGAAKPDQLLRKLAGIASAERIEDLHREFDAFLHPAGAESTPAEASHFHTADHSTANDNASGLRGGGSAIEHLSQIMAGGGKGFIALFRLSCLNMINQRFGPSAVEDCLMAVAAFLTQSLNSDDSIYHWSDSSLIAILQGRVNEQILAAELGRIAFQNRETSVNIGGRSTMLRIPITFDIVPIDRLQSADDLYKIALLAGNGSAR